MLVSLALSLALMASAPASRDAYLERTIQRGVPLYNQGMPAACAAVYATALEGIAHSDGWGLEDEQRTNLHYLLEMTAALPDPDEQAWAYRSIIDTLLSGEPLSAPALPETLSLFDFSDPADVNRWQVVVDGVMGGLSSGKVEQQQDSLVFTGQTSLRNNGGFSSIRASVPAGSLAGYDALRIRIKGDGRTWIVGASSNVGRGGNSYWSRFDTREGEWQTVTVPIADMVRQFFGTPLPGTLQPSAVRGVEFYIYDKQAGDFHLEVEQIEAVRSAGL